MTGGKTVFIRLKLPLGAPMGGLRGTPMSTIAPIALSGMQAARVQLDTAAHNIANAQTAQFRRQQVTQEAQPEGGVTTTISRSSTPGPDFAGDTVAQLSAGYAFVANLRVVETEHHMLGALLDVEA